MDYVFKVSVPEGIEESVVKNEVSQMMHTMSRFIQENGMQKNVGIKSLSGVSIKGNPLFQ